MRGSAYKVFQSVFDLEPILFDSWEVFDRYRSTIFVGLGLICDYKYSYIAEDNNVVDCYLLRRA